MIGIEKIFKEIKKGIIILMLFFSFSQTGFAQGDIFPLSQLSFTGGSSVCQNGLPTDLVFSFNTQTCGSNPFSEIDLTVTWFSNPVNTTSGGIQVSQVNSTTATTSYSYTPPTSTIGTLYYYVELSWGTGFTICTATATLTSNETQAVVVNPIIPVAVSISASATTICANTAVTFTATPTNQGASPNYQWQVNGINAGSNSPVFTTSTLANSEVVTVILTSSFTDCISGNPATSNAITMTVNPIPPAVIITPSNPTSCTGSIQPLSASSGNTIVLTSGIINLAIPDFNANGVSNTIAVSGIPAGANITGIDVNFNINHNNDSDLVINLRAPNNNVLNLFNRKGVPPSINFVNTVVSSTGVNLFGAGTAPYTGVFAADGSIGVGALGNVSNALSFNSLYAVTNGNWIISVRDLKLNSIAGLLGSWSITIKWTSPITWSPITDLFTDAGATIAYTNGQISPTVYVKPTAAGTIVYTATATGSNGCTNSSAVSYNVIQSPTVSATPVSQSVCSGTAIIPIDIINPNALPGTTFSWTRTIPAGLAGIANSGSGSTISGTFTNSTNAPVTTIFTITATNGTCSSSTNVTVTVNPVPTVNSSLSTQTVCSGSAITNIIITNPNAVSGTLFSWTRDNLINLTGMPSTGTGSPVAGTLTNNTNVQQTSNFIITASAGTCSSTTTATVVVNPRPTVNALPATQTKCSGVAITQINVSNPNLVAGTVFTWIRDNTVNLTGMAVSGSGSTITGTLINNTITPQTTVFTITATAGACTSTSTVSVIVNPVPVVNVIANVAYCNNANGAAINFGSNIPGSTFSWASTTDVGFGLAGSGNIPAFIAANGPASATVSVFANINGCQSAPRNFTVTIYQLPSVSVIADYCLIPGKIRLTANPLPAGVYTYLWTTGATTSFIDVDIAGNYGVTVTNSNGCKATNSISIATELAVNGNFEAGNTGFTTGYTYNAAANGLQPEGLYAVNNNPNFNHTNFWGTDHTTGTGKLMIINGVVGPIVWEQTVSVVPNTTYYFSAWALSMNNVSPFAQLQFSVNGSPIGVSAVLVPGVNNNASNTNWQRFYGTWSSGALSTATCSIIDLQSSLGGNDFGLDDISISTLSPAALYVFPSVLGGGATVCQGNTLNLSANLFGGSSPYAFSWTGPAGFTSNLQNPSIPAVTAANTGTYTVTVTDFYGCTISSSRVITITPPAALPTSVTATPVTICLGNSSNLNAVTPSATQADFTGFFAPGNWVTSNNPVLTGGSVNISNTPTLISITSGNNATIGNTDYTITNGPVAGNFTFNWSYNTSDAASRDIPQYSVNGGAGVNLPGFNTAGANIQSGTASIAVPANQTFALRMRTTTGTLGAATTSFYNFSAPVAGRINWYTVPVAGISIGNSASAANFPVTPLASGTRSYYAEANTISGCISTSRIQINLTVNTNPSFSVCPSNMVTTVTPGTCSKIVSYSSTVTGSSSPTITYSFTGATTGSGSGTGSGATFNRGITTVTITANTGCAPNATCSFTITVNDNQAPVFSSCPANAIRNTAAGICTYTAVGTEFNAPATDNCSVTSNTATLTGATVGAGFASLATRVFNRGVTTVTWTASDGTNTAVCSFTVTVNDNQLPLFTSCPANATRNTPAGICTYTSIGSEFNSTATDNCSVTSKTAVLTGATTGAGLATLTGQVFNRGVTTVTWTATDGTNNSICSFTVTVNDNQPPVFTSCPANATRNATAGTCTYTSIGNEFNSTATDNCSVISKTAVLTGVTTGAGLATLTGQVFNRGVTTVTWTATDGTNNSICSFTVTVNDNQPPAFTSCPANATRNTAAGTCTYTSIGNEFNSTATDNCSVTSKTAVLTGVTTGAGLTTLTGQVFNRGVTTVTWTASDGIISSTCIFTVTVTDNQAPAITCQPDIITCSTPVLVNPLASDNCPGLVISNNAPGIFPTGTTVVTWTATDASGNSTTCNQNVTLNPPSPATPAAISGFVYICEETPGFIYSISPVLNATTYNWTVPTGWTITSGIGTTSITVTSGNTAQSGNISVYAGNFCGNSSPVTKSVIITSKGTWIGNTTDWNDPSNWCGGIPSASTNVFIPLTGTGIYPAVSSATAKAQNLTIASGASLIVNNYTLQISGTIFNNGGIFDASNGIIELNGTGATQNIAGSMFMGNKIRDLRISNSNGVNITGTNDSLKLSGVLKFGVSNAILNTNNNLTLLSSASGTASVGDMTNNGVNSGNDIIGNVTVERYIPNHFKAWQFLAVPTKGATVNEAWQEGNTPLSNTTHPGYGTIITSNIPGAVALGFDVYTSPGPSMKSFDTTTNGWIGIANTGLQIANKKGYMLFVRGDRSVTASNTPATSTILRTTGKLYTTGIESPSTTDINAGKFESIGNPYASAIDFGKVTKTGGIQDLFYVWDPLLTSSTYSAYGLGAYQTIIGPGPFYTVIPGGGSYAANNTNIESGQAFIVHAPFSAGSVSFTESCKVDGSNIVTRPSNSEVKQVRSNLYVISGGQPVLLDGNLCQFDMSFSNEIDEMDADKIANSSENFGIIRNGKKLVAERRADIVRTDTIYYNLEKLRVQQYRFEFKPANLEQEGVGAFLEDRYMLTTTPVSLFDTTIVNFNVVNIPGSYAPDRFRLVFQKLVPTPVTMTSIAAMRNNDKSISIRWDVENETNMQLYTVERSEDGRNFIGIITANPTANNGGRASYSQIDISPLANDNFYRIKAQSIGGRLQYSSIVKIAPQRSIPGISVYPNPVTGNTMHLQFIDQIKGRYKIQLLSTNGMELQLPDLQINESRSNHAVKLPVGLASGTYMLRIAEPDGNYFIKSIHVSTE